MVVGEEVGRIASCVCVRVLPPPHAPVCYPKDSCSQAAEVVFCGSHN